MFTLGHVYDGISPSNKRTGRPTAVNEWPRALAANPDVRGTICQPWDGDRFRPHHRDITKIPAGPPQVDITGTEAITPGDIVVVPALLPELIDTVQMAGGLIFPTETGLTGRGPVFARGEEIPAVVDCPVVATEVEEGEQVTVDADEGKVIRY